MFRILALLLAAATIVASAASDLPSRPAPIVRSIEPDSAKPGDSLVATGQNLGKEVVLEVYLTQGETSFKSEIKSQTPDSLTFIVPSTVKAGRFGFSILTRGPAPLLVDQPVVVTIE